MRLPKTLLVLGLLLIPLLGAGYWYLHAPEAAEPALPNSLRSGTWLGAEGPRHYRYYLPSQLKADAAIVLVLHGSDGDGLRIRRFFGKRFDVLAERDGFIVVYPDGYQRYWNGCRAAGPYAANTENIDDIAFLIGIAEQLSKAHGANSKQLYATGLSNGGHMSMRLALEASARLGGFAAISAGLPASDNFDCQAGTHAVNALFINGSDDPINPYNGGPVTLFGFGHRGNVLSSQASADQWRNLADLSGPAQSQDLPDRNPHDGSRIRQYRWADDKHEVQLLEVIGGGHTIPSQNGYMPRILGRTNQDIDAADAIWAFFQRHLPNS